MIRGAYTRRPASYLNDRQQEADEGLGSGRGEQAGGVERAADQLCPVEHRPFNEIVIGVRREMRSRTAWSRLALSRAIFQSHDMKQIACVVVTASMVIASTAHAEAWPD